jgi:hypothetical protein
VRQRGQLASPAFLAVQYVDTFLVVRKSSDQKDSLKAVAFFCGGPRTKPHAVSAKQVQVHREFIVELAQHEADLVKADTDTIDDRVSVALLCPMSASSLLARFASRRRQAASRSSHERSSQRPRSAPARRPSAAAAPATRPPRRTRARWRRAPRTVPKPRARFAR